MDKTHPETVNVSAWRKLTDMVAPLVIAVSVVALIASFSLTSTNRDDDHQGIPLTRNMAVSDFAPSGLAAAWQDSIPSDLSMRLTRQLTGDSELELRWLKEVRVGLEMAKLQVDRDIQAALAELEVIERLREGRADERVLWRRIEANKIATQTRLRLSGLYSERDDLSQKFVEGSIWLNRMNALIAATDRRLRKLPTESETERVIGLDTVTELLDSMKCLVEVRLAGSRAISDSIMSQLQEVLIRMGEIGGPFMTAPDREFILSGGSIRTHFGEAPIAPARLCKNDQ